jgi:P4 family phage/plasmid primase-like protien
MIREARPLLPTITDLDEQHHLFNLLNGTFDTRTGEVRTHQPSDHLSMIANVHHDPAAECPRWEAAVAAWMENDLDRIRDLKRFAGSCLEGGNPDQRLHLWHGTGGNGKSTFIAVMREIFGSYAAPLHAKALVDATEGTSTSGHTDAIAFLGGKRFVYTVELGSGRKLDEAFVKTVTGGDSIQVSFKHGRTFTMTPQFKPVLATNHEPEIRGHDKAIWDRIIKLAWKQNFRSDRDFNGGHTDDGFLAHLLLERSGILNWLIEGLLDWKGTRLRYSEAALAATKEYREDQEATDPVRRFVDEECTLHQPGVDARVGAMELYSTFLRWWGDQPESKTVKTITQLSFSRRLTEMGIGLDRYGKDRRKIRTGISIGKSRGSFQDPPSPVQADPFSAWRTLSSTGGPIPGTNQLLRADRGQGSTLASTASSAKNTELPENGSAGYKGSAERIESENGRHSDGNTIVEEVLETPVVPTAYLVLSELRAAGPDGIHAEQIAFRLRSKHKIDLSNEDASATLELLRQRGYHVGQSAGGKWFAA